VYSEITGRAKLDYLFTADMLIKKVRLLPRLIPQVDTHISLPAKKSVIVKHTIKHTIRLNSKMQTLNSYVTLDK
jgi:hypothetical protein